MKAIHFFYLGVGLNVFMVLVAIVNFIQCARILPEFTDRYALGALVMLSFTGGLLTLAFWLKNKGKMLIANVLVWVPVFPLLFIAGLAILFIVGSMGI